MIVRVLGEGQYVLDDTHADLLNGAVITQR